jgi:hypothetical protein
VQVPSPSQLNMRHATRGVFVSLGDSPEHRSLGPGPTDLTSMIAASKISSVLRLWLVVGSAPDRDLDSHGVEADRVTAGHRTMWLF